MQQLVRTPLRFVIALIVLSVLTPASPAHSQGLPSVAEVVDRYVEAIGGRAAVEGHSSLHSTGVVEVLGQGLVGEMEVYMAAPDKMLQMLSFADAGFETRLGYDGEVAWSIDTMMGERLLQGGELDQLVSESDFYSDLHNPENFESMETVELVEFDGRPAHKVRLVHTSGQERFEYFDVETGLMSGVEGEQDTVMGKINVVTYLRDYQDFNGILRPATMLQEMGSGQALQLTIQTVEYDGVDPSVFELPASIQALRR